MKATIFALAFLTAAAFSSCKHTQYTPSTLPAKQLHFGNGGGVVGKEVAFTLLENGQLFKRDGIKADLKELSAVKQRVATPLFKSAETLGLSKLDFTHPGNTYNFLEVQDGATTKRISWGDAKFPVDSKIQDLYNQLVKLVSDKK
jgi:hypothetical protein